MSLTEPAEVCDGSVRDALPEDCERLAAIYNEAILSGRSTMDTVPVAPGHFLRLLAKSTPREALVVACRVGTVIGWGAVKRYSDRPGYRYACETSVYVAQGERGRGVGTSLLRTLIGRARALGYRHLVAKVLGANPSSIGFHQRFGFEVAGRQRGIGFLNGAWQDVVILQRLIQDDDAPRGGGRS